MKRYLFVAGCVLAMLAAGCGQQASVVPTATAAAPSEPKAAAPEKTLVAKADDAGWGTVKGQVVFAGTTPAAKEIKVTKDEKHCLSKGPLPDESWVINKKNNGVRWVFVWLAPEPNGAALPIHPDLKAVPKEPAVMDQPCCAFIPHCMGMREGQELIIKNSAPVPHNINCTGNPKKNPGFNVLLPPTEGKYSAKDLKADRYPLNFACNIHPWMNARVAVFDHPYFAVTDENGNFEIKNAPVGKYRLKVWHESVGWKGGAAGRDGDKIEIKKDGTDLGKIDLKDKYE
jgi:hypothetical protein